MECSWKSNNSPMPGRLLSYACLLALALHGVAGTCVSCASVPANARAMNSELAQVSAR